MTDTSYPGVLFAGLEARPGAEVIAPFRELAEALVDSYGSSSEDVVRAVGLLVMAARAARRAAAATEKGEKP